LCAEGSEAFESLPVAIRNLCPWTGGPEEEVDRLRLPLPHTTHRAEIVVIHANVSEVQLENVTSVRALHPANTDCPECKGKGEVPQHGGLRQKSCWRCAGRGWLRTPIK